MTVRPLSGYGLLEPGLWNSRIASLLTDAAYVDGVLSFERALARASAAAGVIPPEAAEAVVAAARLSAIDLETVAARAGASGSPVVPIVEDLCAAAGPAGAAWVHYGATSQDALDTAAVLVAKGVLDVLRSALAEAAASAAEHARREAETLMVGRTLGQHAGRFSFGLKAAGWCLALCDARRSLGLAGERLGVQLGGATGSLSGLGGRGDEVRGLMAQELGLVDPVLPWHTNRTSIAELAASLAVAAGVWSKVAIDVILLAQTEIGEVREGGTGRGRSSAMPHKQNPSRSIEVRAGALRVPALVSTVFMAMGQENERGAGTWQAEWVPMRELLQTVGGIALQGEELLATLEIDRERMRQNFELLNGLPLSEQLANLLSAHCGRLEAQAIVRELVTVVVDRGLSLQEAAAADQRVRSLCGAEELAEALDIHAPPQECARLVHQALKVYDKQDA